MSEPALRDAAFGARPDLPVTALPADPVQRWLAAVVLGGQGRYAAAATVLTPLCHVADPVVAALAASTLASHRRQLGGHRAARSLDAAALAGLVPVHRGAGRRASDPDGVDATGAWQDAMIGLAADAVGLGRPAEARRLVTAAAASGVPGWRAAIRLGWVSAEVELAAGHARRAVPHAESAAALAANCPSVRHQVKSALVLGASLAATGTPEGRQRARAELTRARQTATALGLLPLAWPCDLLLAELEPEAATHHRRNAGLVLHCVLRRADAVGRTLADSSGWVPDPVRLIE